MAESSNSSEELTEIVTDGYLVNDYMLGLVSTYPQLTYLDLPRQSKVVFRRDIPCGKRSYENVAIISGGCNGDETAYAGYVGYQLLTVACCGDSLFLSNFDFVITAIQVVTGHKGCLLNAKNINLECTMLALASLQAQTKGFCVNTVFMEDDCSGTVLENQNRLVGIILVDKVVGAAAAEGLSLDNITKEVDHASKIIGTLDVKIHAGAFFDKQLELY